MKIVIAPLADKTAREIGAKGTTAKRQRVNGADGTVHDVWTLDLGSDNFERDLTYVFGRNVARARQENKRLTGSADGVAIER